MFRVKTDALSVSARVMTFALLGAPVMAFPGCATVVRGPNVAFNVVTDPPGATVTTDLPENQRGGKSASGESDLIAFKGCTPTPCKVKVSRRSEFITTVTMPGYHPATIEITSGLGKGNAAVSATGAAVVSGTVYGVVYGVASFLPTVFGSSVNAGAAAGATQAATGLGVLLIGVDLASGAMLDVRPNPLVLVMIPETEPIPENLYIDSEEDLKDLIESREGRDMVQGAE